MLSLRPYQLESIEATFELWREKPKAVPLIVAPTGSGKSLIIADIVRRVISARPQYRIIMATHRKEIISQNAREMVDLLNMPVGIYSAGLGSKTVRAVTCAGIQSIYKKKIPAHLVIIDECHLFSGHDSSMYGKFINNVLSENPDCKIMGLTATPYRLDQGSLIGSESFFTDIAYDIDIPRLIQEQYLSPIISRPSSTRIDLTGVRKSGYDYNISDLEERFSPLIRQHCEEILALGSERRHWLLFCSTVKHTQQVSACLNALGIHADFVTGDMLPIERDQKINRFKNGETRALVNCEVLTTGFNFPGIDLLAILRATKSTALYVQMVGRGMRIAPGKLDCLVLDFGNNIDRHGPIDCIEVTRKEKSSGGEVQISKAPSKECPNCGIVTAIRTLKCPFCGYDFPLDSTKFTPKPSTQAIISEVEEFDVESVSYREHRKEGKPPSLMVRYNIEKGSIAQWLCFEHGGIATRKAREWWRRAKRSTPVDIASLLAAEVEMPQTTAEALTRSFSLKRPSRISAIKRGKFYEILRVDFDEKETPIEEII